MKFRCPYCKTVFTPQDSGECPNCGKVMRVPNSVRPSGPRVTVRKGETAEREAGAEPSVGDVVHWVRNPAYIFGTILVLAVVTALLVSRAAERDVTPSAPVEDWRAARAHIEIDVLRQALDNYKRDCGSYPLTDFGLMGLMRDPDHWGWKGPYLTLLRPDPWGYRYVYSFTNGVVSVFSMGADARAGTDDDIHPSRVETNSPTVAPAPVAAPAPLPDLGDAVEDIPLDEL